MNQSIRFRGFGFETSLIGAIGSDEKGSMVQRLLGEHGVNTSHLHTIDLPTASNRLIVDDHGERFGEDGAWVGGAYEGYLFSNDDWDYLREFKLWVTHANSPAFDEALKRKHEGQRLAVDFLEQPSYDLLQESISKIDIAYFGGTEDMIDPLAKIAAKHDALIVLTLGAKGSMAFQGSKAFSQKAMRVPKVVDTTGCGDAFQAAFTASFLEHGSVGCALTEGAMQGRETASHLSANRKVGVMLERLPA